MTYERALEQWANRQVDNMTGLILTHVRYMANGDFDRADRAGLRNLADAARKLAEEIDKI